MMEFNLYDHQWPVIKEDAVDTEKNELKTERQEPRKDFIPDVAVQTPYPVVDCGIEFGYDDIEHSVVSQSTLEDSPALLTCKPNPEFKLLGGTGSGKRKHTQLNAGNLNWFHLVNCDNEKYVTADGPYGQACDLINLKNNKNNRKRLQMFYLRKKSCLNKTSTRQSEHHSDTTEETQFITIRKKARTSHSSTTPKQTNTYRQAVDRRENPTSTIHNTTQHKRQKLKQDKHTSHIQTKNTSHIQKPKVSSKNLHRHKDKSMKKQHNKQQIKGNIDEDLHPWCICNANNNNWQELGPMVQCEACCKWYHFSCILKKQQRISDSFFNEKSKFICGSHNCKFSKSKMIIGGRSFPLINLKNIGESNDSVELSLDVDDAMSENSDVETKDNVSNFNMSASHSTCQNHESTTDPNGSSYDPEPVQLLSHNALGEIFGVDVPKDFFVYSQLKSRTFNFEFDPTIFHKLKSNQKKRCFAVNSWQKHFIEGIHKSNPYCVFTFKNHSVSGAKIRNKKVNSPIFKANGSCKFSDCTCKVNVTMYCETLVHVQYTNSIKHDIHEHHSRPLVGEDRDSIKKIMKTGEKPLNVYQDQFQEIPASELIAGNIGNIGMNTKKIIQVGVESRQVGRRDPDLITSLLVNKEKNNFVQKVCASPMYVLYWSDVGIRLYNETARSNTLLWDATGSVVRKGDDGKQFLYYEMSVAHPIDGKMGIPLCAMLSCDQSMTTVLDWLRSFRHAEKLKCGYNNAIKYPKIIISDQSMVFILAALKEFNNEDLPDFLLRAYKIGKGEASIEQTQKTIIHLCKSHYLNTVKRYLRKKEVSLSKVRTCLFIIGLLMKCNTLTDLNELLFDIIITLSYKNITSDIKPYLKRLISKLNSFQVSSYSETDYDPEVLLDDQEFNANRYAEEEYQILGSKSPFKTLTTQIQDKTLSFKQDDCDEIIPANNYYCPIFLDYFVKTVMPLYPLWSSFLLGNLQRFNKMYPSSSDVPGKTTNSLIENRFRILKFLSLRGRTQHRIDEFSEALRFHTINIQKKSALDCLKTKTKLTCRRRKQPQSTYNDFIDNEPPQKKNRTLIKESWNKKKQQPGNIKNKKIGKYQKPPKNKLVLGNEHVTKSDGEYTVLPDCTDHAYIAVPDSEKKKRTKDTLDNITFHSYLANPTVHEVNGFRNFGLSCWFNAAVQAYYFTRLANKVISENHTICIGNTETEVIDSACRSVIDIWVYMKRNIGKQIPISLLRTALLKTCVAIPDFSQDHQQDASEFISSIIGEMPNSITNSLDVLYTQKCLTCNTVQKRVINEGHLLIIPIERSLPNLDVQTLLDNHFSINDEVESHCSSCELETSHEVRKTVSSFPDTLAIVLGRYFQDRYGKLKKTQTPVVISTSLDFSKVDSENMSYQFKSAICHKGSGTRSGHYVAIVKSDKKFLCCDDSDITEVKHSDLSNIAYVLIYNKATKPLPKAVHDVLKCLCATDVFKKISKDPMVKYLNAEKVKLINYLACGLSLELERIIESELGLKIYNNVNLSNTDRLEESMYSLMIDYLLGNDSDNSLHVRNKFFMVNSIELCVCKKCKIPRTKHLTSSIINLENRDLNCDNLFPESLKRHCRMQNADIVCKCETLPYYISLFFSLPTVLVFNVQNPKTMTLPRKLCLLDKLDSCYPLDSMNFTLKAIVYFDNNLCNAIVKHEDQYIDAKTKVPFNLNDLKKQDGVYLFYNKSLSHDGYCFPREISCSTDDMPEIQCVASFSVEKKIKASKLAGVRITKDFYFSLIDVHSWLNNDHINVYFNCIATNSLKKVHSVECGWFIQNLFKMGKIDQVEWLINCLESKKKWFEFDFIAIPVHENNAHWTVLIVDIIDKTIYYCNSRGSDGNYQYIASQIWRYLCFEAVMHTHKVLMKSEWRLVDYSKQVNFPFQTDFNSCGVYTCAVAKAIIFNLSLPKKTNLTRFRFQMATEISCM